MSAVLITGVFLGFAPTYYLRPPEAVPIPRYLHVHGAAMTAWFLLLLLQSLLIATGRRSIHRRTGIAGAVIAVVITLVNPFVVVWGVPKGLAAGMLLGAPPQLAPSKLVQFLKGRSSRLLQQEFPALRKRYWGQHLWARGYYCASVGAVDEQTIREYIENQRWDEDIDGFKITAPTEP